MVTARLCIGAALALLLAAPARADEPSLLGGTWIHSENVQDYSHPGQTIRVVMMAQFAPGGQLTVKWAQAGVGGSGEFFGYYTYELSAPGVYSETLTDYAPKQDCTSGVCLPWPSMFGQPGAHADCRYAFQSAVMVDINCADAGVTRFTRH